MCIRDSTYIFVTHDLSVVRHISTNICVMYLGQMVETCPTQELFDHPYHPYTLSLIHILYKLHRPLKTLTLPKMNLEVWRF